MADIVAVPAETRGSYVEWAAIIAGAIVASALSFVLLTAGAAIGLSLVSPYAGRSAGGLAATMAAFWLVFVPILSLLIGGYIAGRMRGAADKGVGSDEVDFRDGIHGLPRLGGQHPSRRNARVLRGQHHGADNCATRQRCCQPVLYAGSECRYDASWRHGQVRKRAAAG